MGNSGPSSLRLLLLGLVIGLLSAFYPRLPAYLPPSVTRLLPFLPSTTQLPEAQSWTKYAQYQANSPPALNHDPYDMSGAADEPKLRRVANPKAREVQEREKAKALSEVEQRAQAAGKENHVGPELPVYFFEESSSSTWESMIKQIKDEIDLEQVITIEASPLVNEAAVLLSGDRDLATRIASALGHFPSTYTENTPSSFPSIFSPIKTASLSLPDLEHWHSEHWFAIGRRLHQLRHQGTVFVALGTAPSSTAKTSIGKTLQDVLQHYTAHPREKSLAAIMSGANGKPHRGVEAGLKPLYVAVGLAEQSEGERTAGGWRFGHAL